MIKLGLEKLVVAVKPAAKEVESFDNQIEILSNIKAIVAEHGLSDSVVAFIDSEDSLRENLDKSSSEAAQAHLEAIITALKNGDDDGKECDDDDDKECDDDDKESKEKKKKDEDEGAGERKEERKEKKEGKDVVPEVVPEEDE